MSLQNYIKEPFPALSHLFGVALSIAGLIILINTSGDKEIALIASIIYGTSLIFLYLASTLTHGLHCSEKRALYFEQCDHAAIFFLIAGTYTPICLFLIKGSFGWTILGIEWLLALVGAFTAFSPRKKSKSAQVAIYLAMGWGFLIAFRSIMNNIPLDYLSWLLGGALFYSVGSLFFIVDWSHLLKGYCASHDIWHLFVLAGSICHFVLIHHLVLICA